MKQVIRLNIAAIATAAAIAASLVIGMLAMGCATTTTFADQMHYASRAYLAAKKGYLAALQEDNAQVAACYEAHRGLRGDAAREACPPTISVGVRSTAMSLVGEADAAMAALSGVQTGAPATLSQADALGDVQEAALKLPLLLSEGGS